MPPARSGLVLSLKRLDRMLEHEPGDLTATAAAGITVDALQAALATRGQWLPLDPPAPSEGFCAWKQVCTPASVVISTIAPIASRLPPVPTRSTSTLRP